VSSSAADVGLWATIADEAGRESALWGAALRREGDRDETPVFSVLSERLFAPDDSDTAILLGDYLYAHGLVRVAAQGDVTVVADLAELVSLCAQLRAEGRPGDGAAWAGTVALLGSGDGRLEAARAALRLERDPSQLLAIAELEAGLRPMERALGLHAERVD
jgi:hypothetical protein